MKIIVLKDILLNACIKAQKVISTKNIVASLDNIMFEVRLPNAVYLSATDLQTHIKTYINAEIESEEDASFCINAKLLVDTLSKMRNIPITIEILDSTCTLSTEDAKYTMPTFSIDDFPLQKSSSQCLYESLSVPIDTFFSFVHSVLFTVDEDNIREILTGVNIVKKYTMSVFGTDGYILTKNTLDVLGNGEFNIIVPIKPLRLLRSFFDGNIFITVGDFLSIRDDYTTVQIYLIHGEYPDVSPMIPEKSASDITFKTKRLEFTKILRLANIYANKSLNSVVVSVDENKVVIKSQDLDFNISATEILNCPTSGTIKIGFNGEKLLNCVKNLSFVDEIEFRMTDSSKQMLISDAEGISLQRTIIMPLKIE